MTIRHICTAVTILMFVDTSETVESRDRFGLRLDIHCGVIVC